MAWLRELAWLALVAATVLALPPYVRSWDISSQSDTSIEVNPSTYAPELHGRARIIGHEVSRNAASVAD